MNDLARMIDHSLLHPAMSDDDVVRGCQLAREYQVATACVKPCFIGTAVDVLRDSGVGVCSVISFPHGNSSMSIKVREAQEAVGAGASEIDMVVNIGRVLGGDWDEVSAEVKAVNDAVTAGGAILKVIFENDYLEDAHIVRLCEICTLHAVAFVKTSTGYGFVKRSNGMYSYRGATDHHLALMREHCADSVQIKAAGGVRTLDDLLRVKRLGVTRVGATATEAILLEARKRGL